MRCLIFSLFLFFGSALTSPAVYFNLAPSAAGAYHGFVWLNSKVVQLIPELQAKVVPAQTKTGKVCGFKVHHGDIKDFPFEVQLLDEYGFGEIRVKDKAHVDYKSNQKYTFQIEAFDCDQSPKHYSERVLVQIEAMDSQGPVWSLTHYKFPVNERLPTGSIVGQVMAYKGSKDGSNGVCKYIITYPLKAPFTIDRFGIIRTASVLHANEKAMYELHIRADDCRVPVSRSSVVKVTINVYRVCKPGWEGLPDLVEYSLNSGVQPVATGSLHLETCGVQCPKPQVTTTMKLVALGADHRALATARTQDCRQDPFSLRTQRAVCGASRLTIDLLPSPEEFTHLTYGAGTVDPNSKAFHFDGHASHWKVPKALVPADHNLGTSFTISFWMRHGAMVGKMKEQILCNADGDGMNRHHYSLFVHNCKLVFLLRREFDDVQQHTSSPAEWRFGPLREVCQDPSGWHHYTLSYALGQPRLLVDGKAVPQPQVVDDHPLHKAAAKVHSTMMVIGACYQGRFNKMVQFFKGDIAGLTLLRGMYEPPNVLQCLGKCGESLLLPHFAQVLESGMAVSLVSDTVQVSGTNTSKIIHLMNKVSYANTRNSAAMKSTDVRYVEVTTTIGCSQGRNMNVPASRIRINVLPDRPSVLLELSADSEVTGSAVGASGLPIFPNLQFVTNKKDTSTKKDSVMVDSCVVRVMNAPLKGGDESLQWPARTAKLMGLQSVNNTHGLVLDGTRPAATYVKVLHLMVYRAKSYSGKSREFTLTCSQENGRHVTRDLVVKLNPTSASYNPGVIETRRPQLPQMPGPVLVEDNQDHSHSHSDAVRIPHPMKELQPQHLTSRHGNPLNYEKPGNMTAVIVILTICGGLFVLLIAVAVYKLRRPSIKQPVSSEEAPFNPSNMRIIINPADVQPEEGELQPQEDLDCSDDEGSMGDLPYDEDSCFSGSEDGEEEEDWNRIQLPRNTHPPSRQHQVDV